MTGVDDERIQDSIRWAYGLLNFVVYSFRDVCCQGRGAWYEFEQQNPGVTSDLRCVWSMAVAFRCLAFVSCVCVCVSVFVCLCLFVCLCVLASRGHIDIHFGSCCLEGKPLSVKAKATECEHAQHAPTFRLSLYVYVCLRKRCTLIHMHTYMVAPQQAMVWRWLFLNKKYNRIIKEL